jgi:hypothetical protein
MSDNESTTTPAAQPALTGPPRELNPAFFTQISKESLNPSGESRPASLPTEKR